MPEGDYLKQQAQDSRGKGFDPKKKVSESAGTKTDDQPEDAVLAKVEQLVERVESLEKDKQASDQKVQELESQVAEKDQQLTEKDEQAKGAIQELKQQHSDELANVESAKEESEQRISRLEGLMKLTGSQHAVKSEQEASSFPNVNKTLAANREPGGMFKEVQSIIGQAKVAEKVNNLGASFLTRDYRELNSYIRQAQSDRKSWNQLIRDMESYAKANGLLRGGGTRVTSQDAATVGSDITGGFLETLSSIMRVTHRPQYIFRNFATTRVNFAKGLGETVRVPRAALLTHATDPDAYLLSGSGTYAAIDSNNSRLQTGAVSVSVQEWGLGKNSTTPPIGLPSFVQAYSMIDLMNVLDENLGDSYYNFEDLKIRSLWDATSRVVYNDGDEITATASDADGVVTLQFLIKLFAYMRGLQIPTYRDGCYGIVLTDTAWSQLQVELIADQIWQAPDTGALEGLANMFSLSTGQEMGPADFAAAYRGKYGNFHVFSTNAYGMGVAGTEGVQTETVAAGARTTRTNYAFGAATVARGIGSEMEIRRDTNDDFGRIGRYIWRSEEGFLAMDVDPTGYSDSSDVPQQLRVIDVRSIG